jgi:hypothetical protein
MAPSLNAHAIPHSIAAENGVLALDGVEPARPGALVLLSDQHVFEDTRAKLEFILNRDIDYKTTDEFPDLASEFRKTMRQIIDEQNQPPAMPQ